MKSPWATFAVLCSLVIGIVLFSVIFGGYSSFLRSQNRIETAKNMLAEHSRNQLSQFKAIATLPGPAEKDRTELLTTMELASNAVDRLEAHATPLPRDLILSYETALVKVNQKADAFIKKLDPASRGHEFQNKLKELKTSVFMSGRRYNKEARYFNTRTRVFPGAIVARIFGMDTLSFDEIPMESLRPDFEKEAQNAS